MIPSAVGRTQELLYFIREIKEKNLLSDFRTLMCMWTVRLRLSKRQPVYLKNERIVFDKEANGIGGSGINPLVFRSEAFCDE